MSAGGLVAWLTGLPSSGKSTLAWAAAEQLRVVGTAVAVLDGDDVRASLVPTPGYDEPARAAFYATLARLAALLSRQGLVVLVPATANRAAFRAEARALAPRYLEVFVDVPPEVCAARDAKGLYAAAARGEASAMPGRGAAYERPTAPDLVVRGDPEDARRLVEACLAARAASP